MIARRRSAGFTLLEVMVAVALLAVVAALAYPGLSRILASRTMLDETQNRLGTVSIGVTVLGQDLEHIAPRPVRDELGAAIAALRGGVDGVLLEATRRVSPLPGFDNGSGLARIDYFVRERALVRREWNVLDRTPASTYLDRTILEDVATARFEFFDGGSWLTFWPPSANRLDHERLPAGVRFAVEFSDGTAVSRVVALAESAGGG